MAPLNLNEYPNHAQDDTLIALNYRGSSGRKFWSPSQLLQIKSSMDVYNKAVILGGLVQLIAQDENHQKLFESIGNNLFMNKSE